MKEEVILDFKVEQGEAIKELEQTKVAIINLKKEQQDLNKAYKNGEKSTEEYAKELVHLEGELKKNNKAYNDNLKAINGVKTQFDKLVEGLGQSIPGFNGVSGGLGKITSGAKAFIATPIGAVIAAIGLALSALTAYFKGSEEGQNNFNKIVKVGTVVLGNLLDIVRDFGGALFKVFTGDFKGAVADLKEGFNGIKNIVSETSKEVEKGLRIENLRAETDVLERQLIVLKATNEARIAELKLKAEDRSLSTKERQDALNEALALQNELSDKAVTVAKNRLEIKKEENSLSDSTKEDLTEEAQLQANLSLIEKDRADKSKEIVTKNQALKQESIALLEKERDAIVAAHNAEILREADAVIRQAAEEERHQKELEQINERIQAYVSEEQQLRNRIAALDLEADLTNESAEANADFAKEMKNLSKVRFEEARNAEFTKQSIIQSGQVALQVAGQAKGLQSAITLISTYFAAQQAYASQFLPVPDPSSPIRGGIAAAIAIAGGLARVAAINDISFAAGGGSFYTKGPQVLVVGDNPGGVERVDVTPISGKGRTSVGGGMIKMAGGGSIVANASTSQIDQSFSLLGALKKMPAPVLVYSEFRDFNSGVNFKEELTTA